MFVCACECVFVCACEYIFVFVCACECVGVFFKVCVCVCACVIICECVFGYVSLSVFVSVCEETLSSAIHTPVQSSLHTVPLSSPSTTNFSCSILQSIRRQVSVCCGVGWTAAGTDRQHLQRVDWMGLTEINIQDCCKFLPKPVRNTSDPKEPRGRIL